MAINLWQRDEQSLYSLTYGYKQCYIEVGRLQTSTGGFLQKKGDIILVPEPALRYLIVCENSNTVQNPANPQEAKFVIIQPVINFNVPFVPTQLSFDIYAAVSDLERGKKYQLTISVLDTEGKEIIRQDGEFIAEPPNNNTFPSLAMAMEIRNAIFREIGRHKVQFLLDDRMLGDHVFDILTQS
jgi:hypothetical protein